MLLRMAMLFFSASMYSKELSKCNGYLRLSDDRKQKNKSIDERSSMLFSQK